MENKSQAKAVDTTLADADGNMMSSRSIMSRGGVFEACFRREERVGNFCAVEATTSIQPFC